MAAPILTNDQLQGIREKLKRAYEGIGNLNVEITEFLKTPSNVVFTRDDEKAGKDWGDWAREHAQRDVPVRFAVIAGEIVHHLRSCLDQIAWTLSTDAYQKSDETAIGFPIFTEPLSNKKAVSSYQRKIEGISSADALKIIDRVQPYRSGNPEDTPLAIVNELDRVDKHHNLVLVLPSFDGQFTFTFPPIEFFRSALNMDTDAFVAKFENAMQIQFSRQVAFSEFGKRKNQAVIPALKQLADAVRDVIEMFG